MSRLAAWLGYHPPFYRRPPSHVERAIQARRGAPHPPGAPRRAVEPIAEQWRLREIEQSHMNAARLAIFRRRRAEAAR